MVGLCGRRERQDPTFRENAGKFVLQVSPNIIIRRKAIVTRNNFHGFRVECFLDMRFLSTIGTSPMSVMKSIWCRPPAHSSSPSIMTKHFFGCRPDLSRRRPLKTSTNSRLNWTSIDLVFFSTNSMYGRVSGMERVSCHANVRNNRSATLRPDRWKKFVCSLRELNGHCIPSKCTDYNTKSA